MTVSDPLATGTLLLLDGRGVLPGALADAEALDALLRELAGRLEDRDPSPPLRVDAADGSSHLVPLDEGHLMMHAFPETGRFALQAFSRHAMPDADLQRIVVETLGAGRVESSFRRRTAGLPLDEDGRKRRLAGERAWARARLVPAPVPERD